MRCYILQSLHRYEEALVSANNAIKFEPNSAMAWFWQALALKDLRRYEEALASCKRTIEIEADGQRSYVFVVRAIATFGVSYFDEGVFALDEAFKRIDKKEIFKEDAALILSFHFNVNNVATWHLRLPLLLEVYQKHQSTAILGVGLAWAIPMLIPKSDFAARSWLEVWQNLAGDRPEFTISLRLLKTAVQYKEKKGDRRVLLELTIEERKLLNPLLEGEKELTLS